MAKTPGIAMGVRKGAYTDHSEVHAMAIALIIALFTLQNVTTTTGDLTLRGTVTDESKDFLPGAHVSLRGPEGMAWVSTNESGKYSFQDVKPGRYQVKADLPGFLTSSESVELNSSSTVDLVMKVQSVMITVGGGVASTISIFNEVSEPPVPIAFRHVVSDIPPWLAQIIPSTSSGSAPAPGWVPKQPTDVGKYNVTYASRASLPEVATFYRDLMRHHGLTIESEVGPTETTYSVRARTKDRAHEVSINAQRSSRSDTFIQLTDSYTLPRN